MFSWAFGEEEGREKTEGVGVDGAKGKRSGRGRGILLFGRG